MWKMEKYYKILELDKIIQKIQELCQLEETKTNLKNLKLLNDLDKINDTLAEVDEATILIQRMQRFPLYFKSDLRKTLNLINKGYVINLDELLVIAKFLDTIKANQVYLDTIENLKIETTYFKKNVDKLFYPKELNLRIKDIITTYGEINDHATVELAKIRKAIRDTEKNIQVKLQDAISKNSNKLTDTIISIRNDRYVIPVKHEFKNVVKGIIHDQSASGETVFIEPLVVNELNNKLNDLKESEKKEIYSIFLEVSNKVKSFYHELISNLNMIVHLDLVFAKAEYALSINAKKPKLNNKGILELYQCRHPLLNVDEVVPNNVIIGKDYQGIIITGPNTGGKTVLLKTVGLLSIMVKAGLLVPCAEESNMMVFDNVFADIGDEQSIDQNLSTFSSHLKNVINIINNVTENSLVLLDELGSGTDPIEGSALAVSIIEFLLKKHCLLIVTSHYSDLKTYAFNSDKIINASVEFNSKTLKPTYKLLIGVPGKSNALEISKTLGLPSEIIENANKFAYNNNDDMSLVLDKLIKQTHEFDSKLNELEKKQLELTKQLEENEKLKLQIEEEREQILTNAEKEASKLISESSKKISELIEELNEMKLREVKAHEIAKIKHEVKELKANTEVDIEPIYTNYEFEANQSVFVEKFGAYGIIIKENKNDRYDVQIGNATVTVEKKYLKPTDTKPKDYLKPRKTVVSVKKDISNTLDLRGLRYEDAYQKLEKYIDDAIYGSLHVVSIIHGFGTGVIREMVQNFLRNSPYVESFRYGGAGEGGQGVTVVTLKN